MLHESTHGAALGVIFLAMAAMRFLERRVLGQPAVPTAVAAERFLLIAASFCFGYGLYSFGNETAGQLEAAATYAYGGFAVMVATIIMGVPTLTHTAFVLRQNAEKENSSS